MAFQLKEIDKVYLLIKDLKTRKNSKKLNYVNVGLFFIKANKKIINYKYELPKNGKIYIIFYVLLLKLAQFKILIQNKFYYQIQKKNEFKVKKIQNKKNQNYLIKQKKYFTLKNTQKLLRNLKNYIALLNQYN